MAKAIKYTYSLTIMRYDEVGNGEEILDRDIPADEVIDMLRQVAKDQPKETFIIASHQDKVNEMIAAGDTETDVYNAMHNIMTASELRKAIETAKSLIT